MMKKILIILFFLSLIFSIFSSLNKLKVPYFNGFYKDVALDVIFEKKAPEIYFNDKKITTKLKIDGNHFQFKKINQGKVNNIKIKGDYQKAIVFVGNKAYYPNQNEITLDNSKEPLDKMSVVFLSFFYNFQYYLLPYIFLILYLVKYPLKFNNKKAFYLILLLSILLRLAQINDIPFWDDEMYVLAHCAKNYPIIGLFNDPGNPPLYFILFKIYNTIIQNPQYYRLSSVIIGVILNLAIFFNFKFWFKEKKALVVFFIAALNAILIYFSQELRCYGLLMLLSVLSSYYLFNFKKHKINFLITNLLLLYTHFYGAFLVFFNFLFGFSHYKKNKSFLLINLITFFCYLPLLIYKKSSITSTFNSWIKEPNIFDIIQTTDIFIKPLILFLIFCVLIYIIYRKTKSTKAKIFVKYNSFTILSTIILAFLVSYIVKPIFIYRYFYVVFPCFINLLGFLITYNYKFKLKIVFQILIFLIFTLNSSLNRQNLFCNHNLFLEFIAHDIDLTKNNYIFLSDTIEDYTKIKEDFNDKANLIYLPINSGMKVLSLDKYNLEKPSVVYVLNLYLDNNIYKNAKKIELYKTPLGVFCKVEI